jgi:hypothetical protein
VINVNPVETHPVGQSSNLRTYLYFGLLLILSLFCLNYFLFFLLIFISMFSLILFPGLPMEASPYQIIPILFAGALFIVTLVVFRNTTKQTPLNIKLFLITSLLSVTFVNFIQYILCAISFFCTKPDIISSFFSVIYQLCVILTTAYISKYYKKSILWLVLVYCILFFIILISWLLIQDYTTEQKSFTYKKTFSPDQFVNHTIPNTHISFPIPKNFSDTAESHYTDFSLQDPSNKNTQAFDYPEFKSSHSLQLDEKISDGVSTFYFFSILIPKNSSSFTSDFNFLNSCSPTNICEESQSLQNLGNGVSYCKSYNQSDREIDQQNRRSPFYIKLLMGDFSFQDTQRTYIAKPTQGYDYCFVMAVNNHETRFTDSATIDKLVNYTFKNLNITNTELIIPNNQMKLPIIPQVNEISSPKCPTPLINGFCQLSNCSYSYPNDLFTVGKVMLGNYYDQTENTYYDTCTLDKKQVNEVQCYGNSNDPYNLGYATYNCLNGCSEGRCL